MRRSIPLLVAVACLACAGPRRNRPPAPEGAAPLLTETETLFDGMTLAGWERTAFGGEGEVVVQDGRIELDMGAPLTGIHWVGEELPRDQYELTLTVEKRAGSDFFCGLTFPVGEQYCSLILGGWGGAVVGLSCIDGLDASANATTQHRGFEANRPYAVKLLVADHEIRVWLDDEPLVEQGVTGHVLSVRPEVELSKPLGIATYETSAAVSAIELERL